MTLALLPRGTSQRHSMIEGAVVTDFRGFTNHHTHTMVNKEAPANVCARVNFDSGQPARQGRENACQPAEFRLPEAMVQTMPEHRVDAWIGGQNLKGVARRGIALQRTGHIFAKSLKHQE